MAVSQNGYVANDRSYIHTLTVPGTAVRLPVRKGPTGDLLIWAAARWHREVEPLIPGTCWGYAERLIRGSATTLSNHASGTAIDLNAPKHPLGTEPAANFTPGQIQTIQRIVADARGCLRWGGAYVGRKDGMHLEVVASEAQCAAALGQTSEDDLATVPQGEWNAVRDALLLREQAWGGGLTDDKGTPYDMKMFLKRVNVETHQTNMLLIRLLNDLDGLRREVSELRGRLGDE